ncbi:eukaryotic translation initiation factor 2D-like [Ciona intestinalis]
MFQKPFRTKSNTLLRSSDKKRLRNEVEKSFSANGFSLPTTEVISNKEDVYILKLYSHKGDNVAVYSMRNSPVLFEHEKKIFPSVYFLWEHTMLVPSIPTQTFVIQKLANGADLMLPGVVFHPNLDFPSFERGSVVAINTIENSSALAVGVALMSSDEMVESIDKRGKAVHILHVFGDHLWSLGEKTQPPTMPHTFNTHENSALDKDTELENLVENVGINSSDVDTETTDTTEAGGNLEEGDKQSSDIVESIENETDTLVDKESINECTSVEVETEIEEVIDMDEVLRVCFMTAVKSTLKDNQLPILASSFYRSHVLPCSPPNVNLEMKKTSYKKLGKYLKSVAATGLIEVKELTKGADSIVKVNRSHPDYCHFKVVKKEIDTNESEEKNTEVQFGVVTQKQYEPPEISLLCGVNAATLPFFKEMGVSKGGVLMPTAVRSLVTEYVNMNNLADGRYVKLDPILHNTLFGRQGSVDVTQESWENIFKILTSKMQVHYQLKFKNMTPIVHKGIPPCVEISTQKRTGNKKVTLVKNLESFLIDPHQFMDVIRKSAQASTSISVLPNSKPNHPLHQVLVQGNQVQNIESILTGDLYKLPRKYLKGLENAPKPKGKRK